MYTEGTFKIKKLIFLLLNRCGKVLISKMWNIGGKVLKEDKYKNKKIVCGISSISLTLYLLGCHFQRRNILLTL